MRCKLNRRNVISAAQAFRGAVWTAIVPGSGVLFGLVCTVVALSKSAQVFMESYDYELLVGFCGWTLVNGLYWLVLYLGNRWQTGSSQKAYENLVVSLDAVVAPKMRELSKRHRAGQRKRSAEDVLEILGAAGPGQQLGKLAWALWDFFAKHINADPRRMSSVRVVIASIQDRKVKAWEHCHPPTYQPGTDVEVLNHPDSGYRHLLDSGEDVLVIPDLEASPHYRQNPDRPTKASGSALYYLIRDGQDPIFFVGIRADTVGVFVQDDAELYKAFLERFGPRLLIEHYTSRILASVKRPVRRDTPDRGAA